MRKTAAKRQDDPHREFVSLFKDNCHRHRPHTVFSDFCEMAALSFSNAVDLIQREQREARYMQIVKGYTADEVARFPHMLGCVTEALEARMQDCLGQLFMSLDMGNHWVGQFFTPYDLAGLMARMTLGDAKAQVLERGYISISEPAVGAGAMVIAMAEALQEQGLNYQRCMHAAAVDVDPTAAHMCYVQLSLLHIPAVVVVGNSLTLEERAHWYTPAHVMGGWNHRLRQRQAVADLQSFLMPTEPAGPALARQAPDVEASQISIHDPRAPSLVQGDLF